MRFFHAALLLTAITVDCVDANNVNCNGVKVVVAALKAINKADRYCSSFLKVTSQATTTSTYVSQVTSTETAYEACVDRKQKRRAAATPPMATAILEAPGPAQTTPAIETDQTQFMGELKGRAIKCAGAPVGLQGLACGVVSSACKCVVTPTKVVWTTTTDNTPKHTTTTICVAPPKCSAPTPDECGTSCVNKNNDPKNCGGCGIDCGTNNLCCSGSCVVGTVSGNCGRCGETCTSECTYCGFVVDGYLCTGGC